MKILMTSPQYPSALRIKQALEKDEAFKQNRSQEIADLFIDRYVHKITTNIIDRLIKRYEETLFFNLYLADEAFHYDVSCEQSSKRYADLTQKDASIIDGAIIEKALKEHLGDQLNVSASYGFKKGSTTKFYFQLQVSLTEGVR